MIDRIKALFKFNSYRLLKKFLRVNIKKINIINENKKYAFCHPIPKIEKIFINNPNKIGENIPCG